MMSGAGGVEGPAAATASVAATDTDRVFAIYFVLQAAVGVVFWLILDSSGSLREVFELFPARPAVTDAFFLADALVIVTSLLSAWALSGARSWAVPMVAFTAGGMVYPTLYLVAWVAMEGTGAACLAIMVPPSVLTSWIAYETWKGHHR
jgi:hypothetical protein